MNFLPSNVALVKVEPDSPVTFSNITMSSSSNGTDVETVTVTTFELDVLVNVAPETVFSIG